MPPGLFTSICHSYSYSSITHEICGLIDSIASQEQLENLQKLDPKISCKKICSLKKKEYKLNIENDYKDKLVMNKIIEHMKYVTDLKENKFGAVLGKITDMIKGQIFGVDEKKILYLYTENNINKRLAFERKLIQDTEKKTAVYLIKGFIRDTEGFEPVGSVKKLTFVYEEKNKNIDHTHIPHPLLEKKYF